ncbi:MAG: glycosyltransferase [Chitinophagaceae bacterium]|nr:glycosyltransferase [Chitinophagaceae bacterium]
MKALIFNRAFFYISETFIYQQVKGMPSDVEIELLGFDFANEDVFPLSNKKIRIKRSANIIDRIVSAISKRVFGVKPGLGFFSANKLKEMLRQSDIDLIHAHFGFNALIIYPVAKALNIPLVITFHGLDASPEYLSNKKYRNGIKEVIAYASGIIIVSPHMNDTLQLKAFAGKTYLISCGVNANEFQRAARPVAPQVINILHSGRLVPKKGVPDLIRVFIVLHKKHPHLHLHIIGDGPELELCRHTAQQGEPDSITFYGSKPHGDVKKIMTEADIFVLNSRTSESGDMEGLPVSVLEAMSMRIPVVSTRHAGIPYVIKHGVNGLLADERNNDQLSELLEKVIVDAGLRSQLGEEGRRTVLENFTWEKINRRISEVYRQIGKVRRKPVAR